MTLRDSILETIDRVWIPRGTSPSTVMESVLGRAPAHATTWADVAALLEMRAGADLPRRAAA